MSFSLKDIKKGNSSSALREPSCQKCLGKGHYTYECKSTERPYVARPSRTAQLKKPIKLKRQAPAKEKNLPAREGLADSVIAGEQRKRKEEGNDDIKAYNRERDGRRSNDRSSSRSPS